MAEGGSPGISGLQNLGNTCFMNSALQCLSNCPPLTEYFVSANWAEDVNEANPLGMGGRLAKAYAGMVRNIWSGTKSSVIPRDFKYTVGQFAPTFSGNHQQDSQELMAFLLDGLHEDLNRIRNKPYVELKDADGRPDEIVAKEAWDDYKLRNDSVITEYYMGQLKSKLVCSTCAKVSVKFDPFCILSLPMPLKQLNLTFVSAWPGFTWSKYRVGVPKQEGTTADIFAALGKLRSVDPARLVLAEVTGSRVRKIFKITDRIYDLSDRDDLTVYEMPKEEAANPVVVCLHHRYKRSFSSGEMWNLAAQPIVLKLSTEDFTPHTLHDIIQQRARKVFPELPAEGVEWMEGERSGTGDGNDGNYSGLKESETSSNHFTPMDTEETSSEETSRYEVRRSNEYGTTASSGADVPRSGEGAEDILVAVLHFPNYFSIDWHPVAYRNFITRYNRDVTEHDSVKKVVARKEIDLTDCLRHFEAEEKLGENDLWYCPGCKDFREASKQMGIWRAPRLFVMHLKRFSYTRTLRDKIENLVTFPLKGLDMGPFIMGNSSGEPILYDLLVVSNHMGGLGGGHYTAFGLNKTNNRWYSFDDSRVSSVPEESIQSKMAYVLVYSQRPVPGPEREIRMWMRLERIHNQLERQIPVLGTRRPRPRRHPSPSLVDLSI